MSKTDRFVLYRLQGMGSREAARQAGFEADVPGGHALKIFRKAAQFTAKYDLDELTTLRDEIENEIECFRHRTSELRRQRHAAKLVERHKRS